MNLDKIAKNAMPTQIDFFTRMFREEADGLDRTRARAGDVRKAVLAIVEALEDVLKVPE